MPGACLNREESVDVYQPLEVFADLFDHVGVGKRYLYRIALAYSCAATAADASVANDRFAVLYLYYLEEARLFASAAPVAVVGDLYGQASSLLRFSALISTGTCLANREMQLKQIPVES